MKENNVPASLIKTLNSLVDIGAKLKVRIRFRESTGVLEGQVVMYRDRVFPNREYYAVQTRDGRHHIMTLDRISRIETAKSSSSMIWRTTPSTEDVHESS